MVPLVISNASEKLSVEILKAEHGIAVSPKIEGEPGVYRRETCLFRFAIEDPILKAEC